jgi:hypothetical protein
MSAISAKKPENIASSGSKRRFRELSNPNSPNLASNFPATKNYAFLDFFEQTSNLPSNKKVRFTKAVKRPFVIHVHKLGYVPLAEPITDDRSFFFTMPSNHFLA